MHMDTCSRMLRSSIFEISILEITISMSFVKNGNAKKRGEWRQWNKENDTKVKETMITLKKNWQRLNLDKLKVERKQKILDSGECQKFNILSKV